MLQKNKCLVRALLGLGALPEAILKLARKSLQVTHAASAVGTALKRLVVLSDCDGKEEKWCVCV